MEIVATQDLARQSTGNWTPTDPSSVEALAPSEATGGQLNLACTYPVSARLGYYVFRIATNEHPRDPRTPATLANFLDISVMLRNIKVKTGLNISDLALAFDVSRQTIYNWELGKVVPEFSSLIRVSNFAEFIDKISVYGVKNQKIVLKAPLFVNLNLLELFAQDAVTADVEKTLIDKLNSWEDIQRESLFRDGVDANSTEFRLKYPTADIED